MLKSNIPKRKSIIYKIFILMSIVIVTGTSITIGGMYSSGVFSSLTTYQYEMFAQKVNNRKNYLETEINNRWSNIRAYSMNISSLYNKEVIDNNMELDDFIMASTKEIISMLRYTNATGAFLMMRNDNYDDYIGAYFKDYEPTKGSEDNSDLFLLKGSNEIAKSLRISLDKSWNYYIELDETQKNIFEKPYFEALNNTNNKYLGYWNAGNNLAGNGISMLTYSIPIYDKNGSVFGVVGVEIDQDNLYKYLPNSDISDKFQYGYVLGKIENGQLVPVIANGFIQRSMFTINEHLDLSLVDEENMIYKFSKSNYDVAVNYVPLRLYENNTPFENDGFVLAGLNDYNDMQSFVKKIESQILVIAILAFLLTIFLVLIICQKFAEPIILLAKKVSNYNPFTQEKLITTNIKEIDELALAIELLNKNVIESANRTDEIINLLEMDIGAFEYIYDNDYVTITSAITNMFSLPVTTENQLMIDKDIFFERFNKIMENVHENNIYSISIKNNQWVKITTKDFDDKIIGLVIDASQEILDNQILKYERDHDGLTRIFNRAAFTRKAVEIFEDSDINVTAFVMCDIDGLKYINDTYGHDVGDQYIKNVANILWKYADEHILVGRMAGDEFNILMHHYTDKNEIMLILEKLQHEINNSHLILPNDDQFKLSISMGVSWYGENSYHFKELIKFADFAMYEGKHSVKGSLSQFDKKQYLEKSYITQSNEEFEKIINNKLYDFAFQPIIDISKREIYGYESLLRPISETLNTPLKLLQVAGAQSELNIIEQITFMGTLEKYYDNKAILNHKKIFINSIPNEILNDYQYANIKEAYGEILENVVVEIIESERVDNRVFNHKREIYKSWNASIALDDFGSGYSNDFSLLNLKPSIIKIDQLMIRGIENDVNKQAIVYKLINYAKECNITLLAEGVETRSELKMIRDMGIRLVQGFYLGRPNISLDFDFCEMVRKLNDLDK